MPTSVRYQVGENQPTVITVTGEDASGTIARYLAGEDDAGGLEFTIGSTTSKTTKPRRLLLCLLEAAVNGSAPVHWEELHRQVWGRNRRTIDKNNVQRAVSTARDLSTLTIVNYDDAYRLSGPVKREDVEDDHPTPDLGAAKDAPTVHDVQVGILADCIRTIRTDPGPASLRTALHSYLHSCVFTRMKQAYRVYLAYRAETENGAKFLPVYAHSRRDPLPTEERWALPPPTRASNAEYVYQNRTDRYIRNTHAAPDGWTNHPRPGEQAIWSVAVLAFGHSVFVLAMAGDKPNGVDRDGELLTDSAVVIGALVETWMVHDEVASSRSPEPLQDRIRRFRADVAPLLA